MAYDPRPPPTGDDPTVQRPAYRDDPTVERPAYRDEPTVERPAHHDDESTVERDSTLRMAAPAPAPARDGGGWAPSSAAPGAPTPAPPPFGPGGSRPWTPPGAGIPPAGSGWSTSQGRSGGGGGGQPVGGSPWTAGGAAPPRRVDRSRRRGGRWGAALVAAVVSALVSTGVTLGLVDAQDDEQPASVLAERVEERQAEQAEARPVNDPLPGGSSVADVAEQVLPAVAQVEVAGPRGAGSGSAVVYREDGYLITNNHVVTGAQQLSVVLADGTRLDAEVVGADASSDVAVLRVEQDGLPVPVFQTEDVRPGETAIAVGSPFGLESTVTSGIISALERDIPAEDEILVGMLQTDAAINPGNSGGPLVNDRGEIIGINTAIFSQTGQSGGIGFAIPARTVQDVAEQLIEDGEVEYAQLGVTGGAVTPPVAEQFGLDVEEGAIIVEVLPGSGADEGGLQPEDVIVQFGDEEIRSQSDLYAAVRAYRPGDVVDVTFLRDGEEQQVEVTLQLAQETP